MTKPTLYYHLASPPARATVLVAKELGLDIDLKEVDLLHLENKSEAYTKINPAQTVPALVDGDILVCDSHAICLYMIEKFAKDDNLYPKNDLKLRTVINDRLFFDASFLFPRGCQIMLPVFLNGESEVSEEKVQQIYRGFDVLERYLKSSKWMASNDRMTVADIAIFAWVEAYSQLYTIEKYEKLTSWLDEMRKLPYYEEANKTGAAMQVKMFLGALQNNRKA